MRFVIINLLLVCLLLLGIGYLAFSHTGTDAETRSQTHYVGYAPTDKF